MFNTYNVLGERSTAPRVSSSVGYGTVNPGPNSVPSSQIVGRLEGEMERGLYPVDAESSPSSLEPVVQSIPVKLKVAAKTLTVPKGTLVVFYPHTAPSPHYNRSRKAVAISCAAFAGVPFTDDHFNDSIKGKAPTAVFPLAETMVIHDTTQVVYVAVCVSGVADIVYPLGGHQMFYRPGDVFTIAVTNFGTKSKSNTVYMELPKSRNTNPAVDFRLGIHLVGGEVRDSANDRLMKAVIKPLRIA